MILSHYMDKVIIYARISREEENKLVDSQSIENQIVILKQYTVEHHLNLYKVIYDDGYSGSSFQRPGFIDLINEVKKESFSILLVKDLSRLGRLFYKVQEMIEFIFPLYNIRVISISDNYDSNNSANLDIVVIKNLLNDYYLKEFKKKCKNSLWLRANTKHLNFYPKYGYYYDSNGNEKTDPYSAKVVHDIFQYASIGKTPHEIALILNSKKVLTRSRYATQILKLKPLNKKPAESWDYKKVWEILKDYEYCGHSVNLVKNKTSKVILKNSHQSIISESLYFQVNNILSSRRVRSNSKKHIGPILKDYQTDTNFSFFKSKNNYYYNRKSKVSLSEEFVHNLLYSEIKELLKLYITNTKLSFNNEQKISYSKEDELKLQTKKLDDLNNMYKKLFEQQTEGLLSPTLYSKKVNQLIYEINNIEKSISNKNSPNDDKVYYVNNFLKFIDNLTENNKLQLIKDCISKVIINKINNHIFFQIVYK